MPDVTERAASPRYVNLDYAASSPLRPEALAAERAYDASPFAGANPNSLHTLGRRASAALEGARREIAGSLGASVRPSEVVFTGGGTESDQLALLGIAEGVRGRDRNRTRVIVSSIEHDAILDNLSFLRQAGFRVETIDPCRSGYVEPDALDDRMGSDVALVSVMLANNETGVIQPVRELARIAHAYGARMHTDAIQAYLHIPFSIEDLEVDALSIAGHKVGGPVSVGALYLASRTPLRPRVLGGGQEAGRRAGTQDVRAALALAAVACEHGPRVADEAVCVRTLSRELYRALSSSGRISPTIGDPESVERLPGIVSVLVDGGDSDELILKLDAQGFAVSAGSACSSGSAGPSHVLRAMGISDREAGGALRISFDERVDRSDLMRFADALITLAEG